MNALVVDTSSWISYFRGKHTEDIDEALKDGRVYLSPIVASELLSGNLKPLERSKLRDFLKELPLCENNFDHWVRVGELRSKLFSQGISVSTPDAHIAQCALDLKCRLLTEDSIFEKIARNSPLSIL